MEDRGTSSPHLLSDSPIPLFPPPASSGPAPVIPLAFRSLGGELFVIEMVNLLLSMITFGIYYPWGRARTLRYMIGGIEVDGDRFAFHGNGRELMIGLLKVWAIFVVPLLAIYLFASWPSTPQEVRGLLLVGLWACIILLVGFASVGSYRYRLSRTSWRGIRFSFRGTTSEFAREFCVRMVLNLVTLGCATPWFATWKRRYLLSHTYFGTEPMRFDGEAGDLVRKFVIAALLMIPTLGMSWVWYHGEQERYFWSCTSIGGARFQSDLSGMGWLGLQVGFGLVTAISLGFAIPWVRIGAITYLFEHLRLEGVLDLASIHQDVRPAPASGEELGDFFNADGGIGIG